METPPTFGRSLRFFHKQHRNCLLILSPSCFATCGHHLHLCGYSRGVGFGAAFGNGSGSLARVIPLFLYGLKRSFCIWLGTPRQTYNSPTACFHGSTKPLGRPAKIHWSKRRGYPCYRSHGLFFTYVCVLSFGGGGNTCFVFTLRTRSPALFCAVFP